MMIRYIMALVLTVLLLAVARRWSTRHAEDFKVETEGITLSHHAVTENFGDGPTINLNASQTDKERALVLYSETSGGPYKSIEMTPVSGGFTAKLESLPKGQKWFYHIEIYKDNIKIAALPPAKDQFIKFKGHVAPVILIPHILCMFATIFFGVLTVYTAFDLTRGKGETKRSVMYLLLTTVFSFIGGFPLGYAVAYQAFGQGWSGIPIGWDITDNKTVILFLFWLVTFLLAARGLKGDKMPISNGTYATLAMVSFIITFITFLIPHSI